MSDESSPAPKSWLDRLSQAFSGEPRNKDELIEILREARANGLLDTDTLSMVEGALQVSERHVGDVMVPRAQMVALHLDVELEALIKTVVNSGHSRFPVMGEGSDEVIGILLAKDLLKMRGAPDLKIESLLRPVTIIPESKPLNVLLKEFKQNRHHMALVVDEYGGIGGLVTIEDVLEEIVGEIDDEHDAEDEVDRYIVDQPDGRSWVKALTPIQEINAHFAVDYSNDDYDTIGGLVTSEFGRLPERGERVTLGPYTIAVLKADARRLHLLEFSRSESVAA
jgi:magnesium and cobalt transporter